MRFTEQADPLWRPKGCATASEIMGVRFPLWAETAAEITPTIDPNGYPQSPINRPASPPYEIFCSISSPSSCFATDERAARHRRTRRRIRRRRRRRGSPSGTHHRGTRLRRSPPAVSGKLFPTSRTGIDLGLPVLPVHRVRRCSSALPNHQTLR